MSTKTLRPGTLVGLATRLRGNISYVRTPPKTITLEDGTTKSEWDTIRTVQDAAEHDAATKVRGRARFLVASVCTKTDFGLLCPNEALPDLEKALVAAKALCDEFNATAKLSTVNIYVMRGVIAQDDKSAIAAINSEVRELVDEMRAGIDALDVTRVREAASRAKQIGAVLSPDAQARLTVAVEAVRGLARRMVKAGNQAASEIDNRTIAALTEARTAFLDLDGAGEIGATVVVGRGVDLTPDTESEQSAAPAAPARQLELS
jgi:hypothetical protein